MDNFNNQQQLNVWKTNQEILDIIDQHTPYPKLLKRFKIVKSILFLIFSGCMISVIFYLIIELKTSNFLSETAFRMFLVALIPLILMKNMRFYVWQREINNQKFDLQQLNNAIDEIKKQGLYSQFIQDSLFDPITNPSEPITYAIIGAIIEKQDKRMEKILANKIETKNKNIANQQKSCVNKYRNKLN